MPTTDPPPAPGRRDQESPAAGGPPCDCGGCREFRAITLDPRREYDREQRELDRALADERARRRGPGAAA